MLHKRRNRQAQEPEDPVPETPVADEERKPNLHSTVDVHVREAVGATFLGIIAIALLMALLRAESRNRGLLLQMPRSMK